MKSTLVQIGDVKQLQKVCLTPVDENNRLLREPPTSWDAIKAGKFMIINGQHSITASQELQAGGCSEPRRSELQLWDAYIVSEGELIDPDTDKMFKEDRKFKLKQQTLQEGVLQALRALHRPRLWSTCATSDWRNSRADNSVPQGIRGAHEIPSAQQPCARGLG